MRGKISIIILSAVTLIIVISIVFTSGKSGTAMEQAQKSKNDISLTTEPPQKSENDISLITEPPKKSVKDISLKEKTIKTIEKLQVYPHYFSCFPCIATHELEFKKIYSLGFASIPYIIDYFESGAAGDNLKRGMLITALMYNLHLPYFPGSLTDKNAEVSKDKDAYTPGWYFIKFKEFVKAVPDLVEKICNSDTSFEEKLKELDKMGMLAVPFLVEKIEQGQSEWEEFIKLQTLGMDTNERFQYLYLYNEEKTLVDYDTKKN